MVNWTYKGKEITSTEQIGNPFGFVYRIDNISTGKSYYGSKQVVSIRKKKFGKRKIASMLDKRKSKYEKIVKEMPGWREYKGSSKLLCSDIEEKGHEFTKEILYLCKSKPELKFREAEIIMCSGSLEDEMSYNAGISIRQVGKVNFKR